MLHSFFLRVIRSFIVNVAGNNHLMNEKKFMEPAGGNGIEYIPTYEDKDGDWMLVGDVPWK